eukprot:CAMPEP_0195524606 /NCGR_PEP_ID=MMETSP0794_2-20130614/24526_1 /TAXON_ID=515487 /ORGANISM="Stephanopyxis turris, Strain CCMP 815" /LENGTH=514 /DNA_ID=CAMNT_0040654859 /DNA_START=121 /DNA_END=1662 /DNA_ORIENTATION=+
MTTTRCILAIALSSSVDSLRTCLPYAGLVRSGSTRISEGCHHVASVMKDNRFRQSHQSRFPTQLFGSFNPLAEEGDWAAYFDEEKTGLVYYFNGKTGESLWEPPYTSFPVVTLTNAQIEIMKEKQGLPEQEEKKGSLGGLFSGMFGDSDAVESLVDDPGATVVEETKKSGFFKSVFGGSDDKATPEVEAVQEKEEPAVTKEKKEGFSFSDVFNKDSKLDANSKNTKTYTGDKPEEASEVVSEVASTSFAFPDVGSMLKGKPKEVDVIVHEFNPIKIEVATLVLPHPEKVSWGGEDAIFSKGRTFGVFDGVSGAEKIDGIPLYSKTLAQEMKRNVGMDGLTCEEMSDALLAAAEFADVGATGASTATVASIGEDGFLRAINLGDSAAYLLRDGAVAARTKDISHYFDCPYQLAEESPDRPKDSTKLKVQVLPGDILLMGSDGVFDNLSDDDIFEAINAVPDKSTFIAKSVVDMSRKISLDETAATPYAKLAKKNRNPDYKNGLGGKVDDISCIVV